MYLFGPLSVVLAQGVVSAFTLIWGPWYCMTWVVCLDFPIVCLHLAVPQFFFHGSKHPGVVWVVTYGKHYIMHLTRKSMTTSSVENRAELDERNSMLVFWNLSYPFI